MSPAANNAALEALLDDCRDSQGLSPSPAPVVGLTSEETL